MKNAEKKGRTILLFAVLVVVVVIFAWHINSAESPFDPRAKKGTLGILSGDKNRAVENTISIILNTSPSFENGSAQGNLLFENPAYSEKLERLEIFRDDTGEMIYQSGYLEPGSYIDYAPLLVELEKGEYDCTAVIYAFELESQKYLGRAAAALKIHILN